VFGISIKELGLFYVYVMDHRIEHLARYLLVPVVPAIGRQPVHYHIHD